MRGPRAKRAVTSTNPKRKRASSLLFSLVLQITDSCASLAGVGSFCNLRAALLLLFPAKRRFVVVLDRQYAGGRKPTDLALEGPFAKNRKRGLGNCGGKVLGLGS